MSTDDADRPEPQPTEVSFGEVAAESRDESVAREGEAVDALPGEDAAGPTLPHDPDADPVEAGDEGVPEQPEISSMLGIGPVHPGDDPVL